MESREQADSITRLSWTSLTPGVNLTVRATSPRSHQPESAHGSFFLCPSGISWNKRRGTWAWSGMGRTSS